LNTKFFKQLFTAYSQKGIALLMVLSTIVILTAIMVDFSFETAINKIKVYNLEDRGQAKLNAKAGLNFAMIRLKLYKEGFNLINKNGASSTVPQSRLNIIWNFPFVYPIPIASNMNQIQQEALKDFAESAILRGQMNVTITNISNKISLNLLQANLKTEKFDENGERIPPAQSVDEANEYDIHKALFTSLENKIRLKSETDDVFYTRYSGLDPEQLVGMLKFFISDPLKYEGMFKNEAMNEYELLGITPKQASYWSVSELYMSPLWSDELIDLIKNEFSVHGGVYIDLNTITDGMLRLLIPAITPDEIRDFFEFRDDPEVPRDFNKLEDFKSYIVNTAALMSSDRFDEKFDEYKKQGIRFGVAPSIFLVSSTGIVGRSTYNLNAYVMLPPKPAPPSFATDSTVPAGENPQNPPDGNDNEGENGTATANGGGNNNDTVELLDPRVIEIFVN
jgi:hypothetical protein